MVLARKREDNKYDFFDAARKKNRKIASIHIWKSKLHISAYNTFRWVISARPGLGGCLVLASPADGDERDGSCLLLATHLSGHLRMFYILNKLSDARLVLDDVRVRALEEGFKLQQDDVLGNLDDIFRRNVWQRVNKCCQPGRPTTRLSYAAFWDDCPQGTGLSASGSSTILSGKNKYITIKRLNKITKGWRLCSY